jgi:tetratricopeptide (TPR) repeat protein
VEKARQAREELEKAGRLEEDAKRIHNDGVALVKIGNDAEAFKKFQEAAEIDPSLRQAWVAIAVTGLKIGKSAEAAAAARKVLEMDPGNAEAVRLQYNAALAAGDETKLVDALVALAAVEPAVARDSLYTLARKSFDADDAAAAKERFGRVLAVDAEHPRANYYMGVLLVREGDKARARTHLQKFLRLAPADPEAGTAKGLLGFIGG